MKQEWWPEFESEKQCHAEKEAFREELFGLDDNESLDLAIAPLMEKETYTWQIAKEFGKPHKDVIYKYICVFIYMCVTYIYIYTYM